MPLCLSEFVALLVELPLEGVSGTATARSRCLLATLRHFRLVASRFSQFAACSGAPSHRPSQGLGLRQFSKWDYSRDLRPAKWGSGLSLHSSNLEPRMSALGQKQTAPWQELSDVAAALVGCGHVSGLLMRRMCRWP